MPQWLTDPYAIYLCFLNLQPGDAIPAELFIAQYTDGDLPDWVLVEKVELEADGLQLLVEDHAPCQVEVKEKRGLTTLPRIGILSFPSKSTCTGVYSGTRGWPLTNQMASLEQQARIAQKRAQAQETPGTGRREATTRKPARRRRALPAQTLPLF